MPTDKFQRWVKDLQKAQPVHPDQTKQTIFNAMHPKRRKWPLIVSTVAVALIIFGVSAATVPPMQEVLAKVPVIGKLFQSAWIIHRISKKQRNPTIHTGLRCFGVSPIGCAYVLRLSR